ncbi:MAG: adenosylcobalamin-dependent ribonucleoside-diphosphate reductase [Deltaproteobacteria bacterium]|nr:adenosylcobalamin-dependent ribonucleoside-diphosphate reductase [Deltaproteobacteria bacterium]
MMTLTQNALVVLSKRYLKKNNCGEVIETAQELFARVARVVASADQKYRSKAAIQKTKDEFFEMLSSMEFLPNSPTLMNAGRENGQLSACFVLPMGDSIDSIFSTLRHAALIQKTGGGTGFNFSKIRPARSSVLSTQGVASGPLSFIRLFDAVTDTIKQGGARRGANMAILNVDHPDIDDFIHAKEKPGAFSNFNFSVAVPDSFMSAVKRHAIKETKLFENIVQAAWKTGEPGLIFIDRINELNPTPHIASIESTNPCGEQPLLPYESCNLGSINLNTVLDASKNRIDWEKLKKIVRKAVHFLDNVIDVNCYIMPQIENITKANRKIGLGVMGFADILWKLKTPYNCEKALKYAEEIISIIYKEALLASESLAQERGSFPNYKDSLMEKRYPDRLVRNATLITIAPTGTISLIAGCSSGIEPIYARSFEKNVLEGERLPQKYDETVITAHEISPEWHVRMQAVFQKHCDNAVSKTVNMAHEASVKDVRNAYELAFKLGCKGITIYRDRSREDQVLKEAHTDGAKYEEFRCPECSAQFVHSEGCVSCPHCGYEKCYT